MAAASKGNSFVHCSVTFPRAAAAYVVVDVDEAAVVAVAVAVAAAAADFDVAVVCSQRLDSTPSIPPPPHPLSRLDPRPPQSPPPLLKTAPRPQASCPCTKTPRTGPGSGIYNHNTLWVGRGGRRGVVGKRMLLIDISSDESRKLETTGRLFLRLKGYSTEIHVCHQSRQCVFSGNLDE